MVRLALIKTGKRFIRRQANKLFFTYFDNTVKNYYLIFNYHQVTEKFDPRYHIKGTWTDIKLFEEILLQLKSEFNIVPLQEGIDLIKNNRVKGKLVSITFDDGDNSIKNVIPILKKHAVPATFFINSAYISNNNYSYQVLRFIDETNLSVDKKELNFLKENLNNFRNTKDDVFYKKFRNTFIDFRKTIINKIDIVIDEQFLMELDSELFTIGLHGHEHERYGMMDYEWQFNDISKNIELLSAFRTFIPAFAIPFGKPWDWNDNTIKIAYDLKLELLFHDFGINFKKEVGFRRIPADGKNLNQILYNSLLR